MCFATLQNMINIANNNCKKRFSNILFGNKEYDNLELVRDAYIKILGRDIDPSVLNFLIERKADEMVCSEIIQSISSSNEYRIKNSIDKKQFNDHLLYNKKLNVDNKLNKDICIVICSNRVLDIYDIYKKIRRLSKLTYICFVFGPNSKQPDFDMLSKDSRVRFGFNDSLNIAKSRNIGIKLANADYYAFFDDDSIPEDSWLTNFISLGSLRHDRIIGGYVIDSDNMSYQYKETFIDRTGNIFFGDRPCYAKPYANGTNMVIPSSVFKRIGLFDEAFTYGYDDSELSWRAWKHGIQTLIVDSLKVFHLIYDSGIRKNRKIKSLAPISISRSIFAIRNGLDESVITSFLADDMMFQTIILKKPLPQVLIEFSEEIEIRKKFLF